MKRFFARRQGFHAFAPLPLFLFCGMYYIAVASYSPYLSAYWAGFGIDTSRIGILLATGALTGLASQSVWALLSDRTGLRRAIAAFLCLGVAATLAFYGSARSFTAFIAFTIALHFFFSAIPPLTDSVITGASKRMNVNYAWVRMTGTLTFAMVVFAFGKFIAGAPERIFRIAPPLFIAAGACALLLPAEKRRVDSVAETESGPERNIPINELVILLLSALACYTMLHLSLGYTGVLIIESGLTQAEIGIANTISSLSEVPLLLFGKRLYKRFGIRMMYIALLSGCLRMALLSLGSISVIYAAQITQGFCYMTSFFCVASYLNENAPARSRTRWFALFSMVQTCVGTLLGNLLGGTVAARIGLPATFFAYAVVGLIISASLPVLSRILRGNQAAEPVQ